MTSLSVGRTAPPAVTLCRDPARFPPSRTPLLLQGFPGGLGPQPSRAAHPRPATVPALLPHQSTSAPVPESGFQGTRWHAQSPLWGRSWFNFLITHSILLTHGSHICHLAYLLTLICNPTCILEVLWGPLWSWVHTSSALTQQATHRGAMEPLLGSDGQFCEHLTCLPSPPWSLGHFFTGLLITSRCCIRALGWRNKGPHTVTVQGVWG